MSRVAFKQCDVERARRAAAPGWRVRVERATGDILLEPVDGSPAPRAAAYASDEEALDAEIEAFAHGSRA